jgi:hypothetical protein
MIFILNTVSIRDLIMLIIAVDQRRLTFMMNIQHQSLICTSAFSKQSIKLINRHRLAK